VSPEPASAGKGSGDWQLPRGPHKLPREVVVDHQRQRLLAGAAAALAEHGYGWMSVENVIERAGVSRTTFYENFDNKRECVLAAHEQALDRFLGELSRACASGSDWPDKVKAGVAATVAFATRSPDEARLLILDSVAAEPDLVSRVLASNDLLVGLLRGGREQCPEARSLPQLTERALIGAASSVIGTRLLSDHADSLPQLEPQLAQLLLIPYLGVEEARRAAFAVA
jgi:AcrR family transcriptional regulator